MEKPKIVIYEKNKDFFDQIKTICDELKIQSFPASVEENIEAGLTGFIGETKPRSVLHIRDWDPTHNFDAGGGKILFLFSITLKKRAALETFQAWRQSHPECEYIQKYSAGFTTSLFFKIPRIVAPNKGYFILNSNREQTPTNDTMYDCEDCLKNNLAHQIISIWTDSLGGISVRECTCCGAQDGPWVIAQY